MKLNIKVVKVIVIACSGLLVTLFFQNCGKGFVVEAGNSESSIAEAFGRADKIVSEEIIYEIESNFDIEKQLYAPERSPHPWQTTVGIYQMGPIKIAPRWNAAPYTGLAVPTPFEKYQRGISLDEEGTTVVQYDPVSKAIGVLIAPQKAAQHNAQVQPIMYVYSFPIDKAKQPFSDPMGVFNLKFDLQVPTLVVDQHAIAAYGGVSLIWQDRKSLKKFWQTIQVIDNREENGVVGMRDQLIMDSCDKCSQWTIAASRFDAGTKYTELAEGSAVTTHLPWVGFRRFETNVTKKNFKTILAEMYSRNSNEIYPPGYSGVMDGTKFSNDPADYMLTEIGLGGEIAYQQPSDAALSDSKFGFSVKGVTGRILKVDNSQPAVLLGLQEGVDESNRTLGGWACAEGVETAVELDVYVKAPKESGGVYLGSLSASRLAESGVGVVCKTNSTAHRFLHSFTAEQMAQYSGALIYTYIKYDNNLKLLERNQAGKHAVPKGPSVPSPEPQTYKGYLDGFAGDAINGWACQVGKAGTVSVRITDNAGTTLFDVPANQVAGDQAAIANICGGVNGNSRFQATVTSAMKSQFGGREISAKVMVNGVGVFTLPKGSGTAYQVPRGVSAPVSCTLPNGFGVLGDGVSKSLFTVSSVNFPGSCDSFKITYYCANGTLSRSGASGNPVAISCTVQQPVGVVEKLQLKRYYWINTSFTPTYWGHRVTTQTPESFYTFEGTMGSIYKNQQPHSTALYECLHPGNPYHYFLSVSSGCFGGTNKGLLGYISQQKQVGQKEIFLCYANGTVNGVSTPLTHFISTDPTCEGYGKDGSLGYVD